MRYVYSLIILIAPIVGIADTNYKQGCHFVTGELHIWNGWPPSLRLHTKIEGLGVLDRGDWVSGIELPSRQIQQSTQFPEKLSTHLPSSLRGEFEICYLGRDASIPYYEKPTPLFEIQSFRNVEVANGNTSSKTHAWAAIQ